METTVSGWHATVGLLQFLLGGRNSMFSLIAAHICLSYTFGSMVCSGESRRKRLEADIDDLVWNLALM